MKSKSYYLPETTVDINKTIYENKCISNSDMSCQFPFKISITVGESILGQKLTWSATLLYYFFICGQSDGGVVLSRVASNRSFTLSIIGRVRFICLLNGNVVLSIEVG